MVPVRELRTEEEKAQEEGLNFGHIGFVIPVEHPGEPKINRPVITTTCIQMVSPLSPPKGS